MSQRVQEGGEIEAPHALTWPRSDDLRRLQFSTVAIQQAQSHVRLLIVVQGQCNKEERRSQLQQLIHRATDGLPTPDPLGGAHCLTRQRPAQTTDAHGNGYSDEVSVWQGMDDGQLGFADLGGQLHFMVPELPRLIQHLDLKWFALAQTF